MKYYFNLTVFWLWQINAPPPRISTPSNQSFLMSMYNLIMLVLVTSLNTSSDSFNIHPQIHIQIQIHPQIQDSDFCAIFLGKFNWSYFSNYIDCKIFLIFPIFLYSYWVWICVIENMFVYLYILLSNIRYYSMIMYC